MYGRLHPRSNLDWMYLPRGEGGRGLASIEDGVRDERKGLALYALGSNGSLITVSMAELKLKKFI